MSTCARNSYGQAVMSGIGYLALVALLLLVAASLFAPLRSWRQLNRDLDAARLRLEALTPREREVMDHVVAGRHNREIAAALAISPRTVEVHKARMMDKLGVGSVAELVRLSLS